MLPVHIFIFHHNTYITGPLGKDHQFCRVVVQADSIIYCAHILSLNRTHLLHGIARHCKVMHDLQLVCMYAQVNNERMIQPWPDCECTSIALK